MRNVYLAMGDSITVGYGASHPMKTFVHQVSRYARDRGIADRAIVLAQNGWTSRQLRMAMHQFTPDAWNQVNLVTLMTGGNDLRQLLWRQFLPFSDVPLPLLVKQSLQQFEFQFSELCDELSNRNIPNVMVATVYNPVPHDAMAADAMASLNRTIREGARSHHFELLDVQDAFAGDEHRLIEGYRAGRMEDLMTPFRRPIHPNDAGHQRIAEQVIRRLSI